MWLLTFSISAMLLKDTLHNRQRGRLIPFKRWRRHSVLSQRGVKRFLPIESAVEGNEASGSEAPAGLHWLTYRLPKAAALWPPLQLQMTSLRVPGSGAVRQAYGEGITYGKENVLVQLNLLQTLYTWKCARCTWRGTQNKNETFLTKFILLKLSFVLFVFNTIFK